MPVSRNADANARVSGLDALNVTRAARVLDHFEEPDTYIAAAGGTFLTDANGYRSFRLWPGISRDPEHANRKYHCRK